MISTNMLNILQYPLILENVLDHAALPTLAALALTCQETHRCVMPVLH